MRSRFALFLLLLAGLVAAQPAAAKIEVRVNLSPERIGLGEVATLTIEVTNDSLSSFRFNPNFKLDNFASVGEVEQVNNYTYGSGGLSRIFRIYWRLRPMRTGTAAIRQLSVEVNGKVLPFGDREVKVANQPGMQGQADPDDGDPLSRLLQQSMEPFRRLREPRQPALFLRQEVEPKDAVVGQQMLYTIYLYARRDVEAMSQDELPKFKGFWARDIPQPSRIRSDFVEIGGETYARVAVIRKALFPLRPGLFHLTPASYDFAVRVRENNLFGPMIERSEPVHLTTPPTNVVVSPLPAAPAGYSGAVGRLNLIASLEPPKVRVGEAATLTLSLGGEGNLQSLDDPRLAAPPGIELSTPQHEGRDGMRGLTVFGNRSWTYSVIPKEAGRFTLQPPDIPYFDPARKEYQIASAAPLTLTVLPALPETKESDSEGETADSGPSRAERLHRALPWGIAGLSTLGALAAVFALLRHRRPPLAGPAGILESSGPGADPAALALRQALDLAAGEPRSAAFAQRSEAAWRTYFEAACSLPPGTPASRWGEVLAVARRDAELRADLEKLLEDLRFLRYAPQLASAGDVRAEAVAAGESLFRRLTARPGRSR